MSLEWNTTDDEMVKLDLKVEQINRTSFAFSGTLDLRYEISENTMVKFQSYLYTRILTYTKTLHYIYSYI